MEAEKRQKKIHVLYEPTETETSSYSKRINLEQVDFTMIDEKRKEKLVSNKLIDLYCMYRKKYIKRKDGRTWETLSEKLNPYRLLPGHLKGIHSIGVFAGEIYSKFIVFDVDLHEDSRDVAILLINTLMNRFNVKREHILTSFSGEKGYHVEIFFDEPIEVAKLKQFYKAVLNKMPLEYSDEKKIEFRPTNLQAVKIPLGCHFGTNKKAYLCDNVSLKEIDDIHILDYVPYQRNDFLENVLSVDSINVLEYDNEDVQGLERIVEDFNLSGGRDVEQIRNDVKSIIHEGMLQRSGTRHKMTFILTCYFKALGYSENETLLKVFKIIENTFNKNRSLLDKEWTLDKLFKETRYQVGHNYKKGYTFGGIRSINVYKPELETILSVKGIRLQRILFAFLLHAKRYSVRDNEFAMSYNQLCQYLNIECTNKTTLKRNICKLSSYIELLEVGRFEWQGGKKIDIASRYKINYVNEQGESVEIDVSDYPTYEEVVAKVFTERELREMVKNKVITKQLFNEQFKTYYVS